MIVRKNAPAIKAPVDVDIQLQPYVAFYLKNGIPVYLVEGGAQEVLQIDCVFDAGNWFEEKNLVAATANFLMKNGTTQKSAFEINAAVDFYGAYLNRSCYNETATFTLHCLNKDVAHLLPLMEELLTSANFPEEELAIYKQNQLQRLEVNLKKCDFVANRLIDAYLYGKDHPYGKYSTPEDYIAITQNDLVEFYNKYYVNGHCKIFVSGKMQAGIQTLLDQHFGHLSIQPHSLARPQHKAAPAEQLHYEIVQDPNGVQGAIRMARPFHNRHHPDFIGTQILNNLFGGFFGSRLMSNIREDKGYTYGIYSYLQNHLGESAWIISTEAGRDVCKATIQEVHHEMKRLREELVDEEELDLVKNYMMGVLLGDVDGPFQVCARWKNYILHGVDDRYFQKTIETIRTIDSKEIQRLANEYLHPEKFYELTVI